MDGALMEIGPYRLKDNEHLVYNEGSWDEFANLLFVDNPVGTGFSYVDTDSFLHDLPEMADQFITFMEKWFAIFPEYESDDVSIFGPWQLTTTNSPIVIFRWRVLRRPAHSLYRTSCPRSQRQSPWPETTRMESEGSSYRQRMDISSRAISIIPSICLCRRCSAGWL